MLQSNANKSGLRTTTRLETSSTVSGPHKNMISGLQVKKEENGVVSEISSCGRL
jgi:hypothetical protein